MRKFVPTFADHLARYVYALEHCYKKSVLDAGGKEGFGAHILSYGANDITIADIDDSFLTRAKSWFKYFCPVTYVKSDFEKDFPQGTWDVVTAFEIIEHLTPEGGDFFVKNISEHLKPGGALIFSVPHMVANHEHKTLYDEEKIKALISKYLTIEELYVQKGKTLSGKPMYKGLTCHVGLARKL